MGLFIMAAYVFLDKKEGVDKSVCRNARTGVEISFQQNADAYSHSSCDFADFNSSGNGCKGKLSAGNTLPGSDGVLRLGAGAASGGILRRHHQVFRRIVSIDDWHDAAGLLLLHTDMGPAVGKVHTQLLHYLRL